MWVSSRRRPMTSPPGGGTIASPSRASNGPARRIDARIRLQSSSSNSRFDSPPAWSRTSPTPTCSTSTPRSATSASIISTSLIVGTFVSSTGSSVSRHAATIGKAAFLLPAARIVPFRGRPPSMTKASTRASVTRVSGIKIDPASDSSTKSGEYASRPDGGDPRAGVGDTYALHAERGAPPSRAGCGSGGRLVRAGVRRGRGALASDRSPPRLRLRDPSHTRQAPSGRRCDPARGGVSRGARGRTRRPHPERRRRDAADRRRARSADRRLAERREEPVEIFFVRPETARGPEPTKAREVAEDHACLRELRDQLGGVTFHLPRDDRGLRRLRNHLVALREEVSETRRLCTSVREPLLPHLLGEHEGLEQSGDGSERDPAGIEAGRARLGRVSHLRLPVPGAGGGKRHAQLLDPLRAHVEGTGHVRAEEPLLR